MITEEEYASILKESINMFVECFSPGQALLLTAMNLEILDPDWDNEKVMDIFFELEPAVATEKFEEVYLD